MFIHILIPFSFSCSLPLSFFFFFFYSPFSVRCDFYDIPRPLTRMKMGAFPCHVPVIHLWKWYTIVVSMLSSVPPPPPHLARLVHFILNDMFAPTAPPHLLFFFFVYRHHFTPFCHLKHLHFCFLPLSLFPSFLYVCVCVCVCVQFPPSLHHFCCTIALVTFCCSFLSG